MSDSKTKVVSSGPGFLGWLTLLFIALKLTGYITWSWFWVLSPLILGFGLVITILILIGLIASIR